MQGKTLSAVQDWMMSKINEKTDAIAVELTTYCPLSCKYCFRHLVERINQEMSWENFQILKRKLESFREVVFCGFGEPMVYSHIYDAIAELKQKIVIITSGTVAIDYKRLGRNIEVLVFSVDVPNKKGMDEITGNYNWENLIRNLREAPWVPKIINCTITEENYKDIPELTRFAVENRLRAVSFTICIQEVANNIIPITKKYLEEARAIAQKGRIVYTDSLNDMRCMSWEKVVPYVDVHGQLYPCCRGLNKEFVLGNIFKQDFDDIWQGERYEEFKCGDMCLNDCPVYRDRIYDLSAEGDLKCEA